MEQLFEFINNGDWANARALANKLKKSGENSDIFWILNSTIYQAEGNTQGQYLSIILGLSKNPCNYELYYMLGEYYSLSNTNQAIICMQQALLYCSSEDDYSYINSCLQNLIATNHDTVRNTSIIINSHNEQLMLESCLNSIYRTIPKGTYEIIVVDDSSDEETVNWLKSQNGLKLNLNSSPISYSKSCNIGISTASNNTDILFLHSDTILTQNAFFWLKMGLYEDAKIGATGAVTNIGDNNQSVAISYDTIDEYLQYATKINLPSNNPYEHKLLLSDFCVLVSRAAVNQNGSFDESILLHNYSMADYGISLSSKGYHLLLCHNSFVYHHYKCYTDTINFDINSYTEKDNNYINQKWGINITYYLNLRYELISYINADTKDPINVLEVGCGCGTTLSKIKYMYPNSTVYGIELIDKVAVLGKNIANIVAGNIEDISLEYEPNSLDYVFFGDVLEHLRDPADTITKLKQYLKPNGKIIASIPNLMHLSVIIPLLKGDFSYADEGLLDRTHIHFFTKNEIIKMFNECNYTIENISSMTNLEWQRYINDNIDFVKKLYELPNVAPPTDFESFQYLVVAKNIK